MKIVAQDRVGMLCYVNTSQACGTWEAETLCHWAAEAVYCWTLEARDCRVAELGVVGRLKFEGAVKFMPKDVKS